MSVTLIKESLGNFDNFVMCHSQYETTPDILYQLCRFLCNYSMWKDNSKLKKTRFYCSNKNIYDLCIQEEETVDRIKQFGGCNISKEEAIGKSSDIKEKNNLFKSMKKYVTISVTEFKFWKTCGSSSEEIWEKVNRFYKESNGSDLKGRSMPEKNDNGFYECSLAKEKKVQSNIEIDRKLSNWEWHSNFALVQNKYNYARVYVGYDNIERSNAYTIWVRSCKLDRNKEVDMFLESIAENKRNKQHPNILFVDTAIK